MRRFLLLGVWAAGCAARADIAASSTAPTAASEPQLQQVEQVPRRDPTSEADEVSAAAAVEGAKMEGLTENAPPPPPLDVLPTHGVAGVIDRAGLVAIVDAGLGRLFQRVRVAPVLASGQFKGFRIVSIDPAWQSVPLAAGDVIVRLNGQSIERPEQAMSAFEQLRMAEELVVEFTRAGVPAELRFRID